MNIKVSLVLVLILAGAFSIYLMWQRPEEPLTEEEAAVQGAINFIKNAPTFSYDGIEGSLEHIETRILESYPVQYIVLLTFESSHAGYGDRSDQIVAQVITPHNATVKVVEGEVVQAVLDDAWDELIQEEIEEEDGDSETTVQSPEWGRDTAIAYITETHEELLSLDVPTSWERIDRTPEGLVGSAKLEFSVEGWTVNVSWMVVRVPSYTIKIEHIGEKSFTWEGVVDQDGSVEEVEFHLST